MDANCVLDTTGQRNDNSRFISLCRITAISAGGNHSVALTVGGGLVVFGRNKHGALGTGHTQNIWRPTRIKLALPNETEHNLRAVQVVCGEAHTLALIMNKGCMQVRSTGESPLPKMLDYVQIAQRLAMVSTSQACSALPLVRWPCASCRIVAGIESV